MINDLAQAIYANATAKGFYENGAASNIGERLALIHSEVSEALEADRKGKHATFSPKEMYAIESNTVFNVEFRTHIKDSFEDELADAMIRIMDLAAHKGIDLEAHILAKMRYNSMREYKHGKKY
jgi:NTP pyrophosphatase (non-canonical NTP hydrolase)